MNLSLDALENHIAYTCWATERLLRATDELSPDELVRDFGTADKSVLGTLTHIFKSETVWLARLCEQTPPAFQLSGEEPLDFLMEEWPKLHDRWREWTSGLSAEDTERVLLYRDMKGNGWASPIWQIVLHVVNHSTHHRGQASGFLRSVGKTPPPLDFIAFMRMPR